MLNLRCALTPKGHPITTTALSFSFSDDSYLALYQLGVVKYIQESIHSDLIREAICVGVGAGCLPAITLRFGIDSDRVIEEVVRETTALGKSWGPFGRISGVVEMVMKKLVPADEERLSENNLQISLTRLSTLENVRKSRFESKKEVLETVLASMANPFTSSSVGATRYISGDYSKSSKVFDKYTFTVSGKANSANICPSEEFSAKAELEAQSDEAIYRVMADKGYKDAAGWFKKRWDSNVLGNLMKKTYPSSVYLANERVASEAKVKLNNSLLAKIEDTFNILADDDLLPEYVNLII